MHSIDALPRSKYLVLMEHQFESARIFLNTIGFWRFEESVLQFISDRITTLLKMDAHTKARSKACA